MKIRLGFVSNSSSASFVIYKRDLTTSQIFAIKNHYLDDSFVRHEYCTGSDRWTIHEDEDKVCGSTCMTNFDMHEFFEKIGVNEEYVKWEED